MRVMGLCVALVMTVLIHPGAARQQDDVEAAIARWAEAFATLDGERSAAVYAPDARLWGTVAAEPAVGRDEIRAYFDSGRQRARSRSVAIGAHATRVYGTTAVASGRYDFTNVLFDGTSTVRRARFSMTFVNQDRQWFIVDHHSSELPVVSGAGPSGPAVR